jgi:hypothetical protein
VVRRLIQICVVAAAAMAATAGPAAAQAGTALSSNWAGFAVHRQLVAFANVAGAWTEPSLSCTRGRQTYSSMWVGLGGYYSRPNALEQIGTDIDCRKNGRVDSSAWFELIPGPTRRIQVPVQPGDSLAASVTVVGNNVRLVMTDATRHWTFDQTFSVKTIDVSSAEWILEAPSKCISATACAILPLAHFRNAGFSNASAESTAGTSGSISSPGWDRTRITLTPGGKRFVTYRGLGTPAGAAKPSKLGPSGNSFSFTFKTVSSARFFAPDVVSASYVQH